MALFKKCSTISFTLMDVDICSSSISCTGRQTGCMQCVCVCVCSCVLVRVRVCVLVCKGVWVDVLEAGGVMSLFGAS